MALTLFEDMPPQTLTKGAQISPCGRYRYHLWREWDTSPGLVRASVIMLNPSTADADVDDPTIRRLYGFVRKAKWLLGDSMESDYMFGGFDVFNLFAYRATDPRELSKATDPVGPENDAIMRRLILNKDHCSVICAWGREDTRLIKARATAVRRWLDSESTSSGGSVLVHSLGECADGSPRHPLYLPTKADLQDYNPCRYEP